MKKRAISFLIVLVMFFISLSLYAAKPTKVEVLYMNHGPLMPTLTQIKNIFSMYGEKLAVSWYDFETREGERFMAKKGVRQHIPLVIWIDDSPVFRMGGKEIKFVGFPTGSGPPFFQGKWTLDNLKAALDQITAKN
jgi:hypothetical protein